PEDVVKVIDGQPVQKSQDLQYAILDKKIGDRSRLILVRNGHQLEVEVLFIAPAGNEQK
ncbi:MAG: PDZ domain-containing protein, partial [Deltaproteobacteria bacterium]|nr:PDZ domain-containing protein [Candidatus Tharpellaceae bacterium]